MSYNDTTTHCLARRLKNSEIEHGGQLFREYHLDDYVLRTWHYACNMPHRGYLCGEHVIYLVVRAEHVINNQNGGSHSENTT